MRQLPLFPLPSVVLFPGVFLPLHIFELRYRQMVADALDGDRVIGMVLLKPGYEADYEGRPPVYATGCSGLITHVERLEDGRFNLILRGAGKFTILREEEPGAGQLYRRATVATVDEGLGEADRARLKDERQRLEALVAPFLEGAQTDHVAPTMADEEFINALAQYLDLEPIEKLALLERPGALARCRSLAELLEMKTMFKDAAGNAGTLH
jgi:hypothetical protein